MCRAAENWTTRDFYAAIFHLMARVRGIEYDLRVDLDEMLDMIWQSLIRRWVQLLKPLVKKTLITVPTKRHSVSETSSSQAAGSSLTLWEGRKASYYFRPAMFRPADLLEIRLDMKSEGVPCRSDNLFKPILPSQLMIQSDWRVTVELTAFGVIG